jgi:hypothetical protein
MAKCIWITFVCLFLASTSFGQVEIGIFGSLNYSELSPASFGLTTGIGDQFDYISGTANQNLWYLQSKSIFAYDAGIVLTTKLNPSFNFRTGVFYEVKGFADHSYNNSGYVYPNVTDTRIQINYLEVPLDLEYTTPVGEGKAFVGVGPFIAYALNARSSETQYDLPGGSHPDSTVKSHGPFVLSSSDKIDAGINAIFGYQFRRGISFVLSYDYSLTSIAQNLAAYNEFMGTPGQKFHFQVFRASVGYVIPRKRRFKKSRA